MDRNTFVKLAKQANPEASALERIRSRARKEDIPFNLTLEDMPKMPDTCPCCGIAPERGVRRTLLSVDRIIPDLGYVKGNVNWLCVRCNMIKNDASSGELMKIALYVAKMESGVLSD